MTNIFTAYDNYADTTTADRKAANAARISAHNARVYVDVDVYEYVDV